MLIFTCDKDICSEIKEMFVSKLAKAMVTYKLSTLAVNYYDANLNKGIEGLIRTNVAGFVFDWGDQFGEEPYGYVGDFYFEYKEILDSIKSKYPNIEIEGHIFMTELGSWDCVYRESVNTTPSMKKIKYTRQLQCVKCRHWRDPKEAHTILSEEGYEEYMEENDLYGSCVLPQGLDGRGWYCICC